MNKITLKNFFTMLAAGLLIIAMELLQGPCDEKSSFKFWLGLVIIVCAVAFIIYKTITISNALHKAQSEVAAMKGKLKKLAPKQDTPNEGTNSKVENQQ